MASPRLAEHPIIAGLSEEGRAAIAPFFDEVRFDEGVLVIREGERDRALYLLHEGTARVVRRGVDVGSLGPGAHVGELALVGGRPRAASVIAITAVVSSRITGEQLDRLCEQRPDLAVLLLRPLMTGVGETLEAMTDNVGLLLRSHSFRDRTSIDLTVDGKAVSVAVGTLLRELLPIHVDGYLVVAALVDGLAVPLVAPVTTPSSIRGLTTAHWEGKRVYRRSLALLLLEGARRLEPPVELAVDYSLGFAQRIRLRGPSALAPKKLARELQANMEQLTREGLPIRREAWALADAIAHFRDVGERGTAAMLEGWRQPSVYLATLGASRAIYSAPFVPSTIMMAGFEVIADGDGLLLVYGAQGMEPTPSDRIIADARAASRHTYEMTRDHSRWLDALGVSTVGEYNAACLRGSVSEVIQVAEGFHEKRVGRIADEIRARGDALKLICISGPSSSGKTTFIRRLRVQLQVNGIRPLALSLDDYYVDRELTPRDADGQYDYEAIEALRLDCLHRDIQALLAGEPVSTPRFDFATGRSTDGAGPTLELGAGEILMIEGIHGLNPALLPESARDSLFRIFVCPLAQLPLDHVTRVHASDLRLLRRIVRDRRQRAISAADNIRRWPSVRRGERHHIYPFQDNADAVFDSSLIYEMSVLKVYAERYLLEVPRGVPEYTTAFRLLQLVDSFVSIYPDHVPPTSILREFIGESGFEY